MAKIKDELENLKFFANKELLETEEPEELEEECTETWSDVSSEDS